MGITSELLKEKREKENASASSSVSRSTGGSITRQLLGNKGISTRAQPSPDAAALSSPRNTAALKQAHLDQARQARVTTLPDVVTLPVTSETIYNNLSSLLTPESRSLAARIRQNVANSSAGIEQQANAVNSRIEAQDERMSSLIGELSMLNNGTGRYTDEGQKRIAEIEAELKTIRSSNKELDSQAGTLAARYYMTENEEQRAKLQKDTAMSGQYSSARSIQEDLNKIVTAMGALRNGQVDDQVRADQKYLMEKYGLTETAVNSPAYESRTDAGNISEKYGSLQALYDALKQQKESAVDTLAGADYDYGRMAGYEQMLKDREAAAQKQAEWQQYAKEHPVISSANTVPMSPLQLVDYLKTMASGIGHSDTSDLKNYVPMNTYNMDTTNFVSTVRGTVSQEIQEGIDNETLGNVASFLYQTGMSVADSAVMVGTMGSAATLFMGASAASNQAKDIIERGGSNKQAFWGGLAAGAAEVVFEKVSIDQLLSAKSVTGVRSWLKETVKQAGVEASEEMLTEVANILSDAAIMGNSSNYAVAVSWYMAHGKKEEQAKTQAFLDCVKQVALAGAGGALSGMAMGGVVNAYNRYSGAFLPGSGLDTPANPAGRADTAVDTSAQNAASGGVGKQNNTASTGEADVTLVQRIQQAIPSIQNMEPVAAVTGNELPKGGKIVERLTQFVNAIGNKVNRPGFGDVLFSRGKIKNSMIGHGIGNAKIETFAAVPAVIQYGQQIDYQENWKGRSYDTYTFAAPVTYRGKLTYIGVIVQKDSVSNRYYLHEVVDENGGIIYKNNEAPVTTSDGTSALSGDLDTVAVTGTNLTVPQQAQGVKDQDAQNSAGVFMPGSGLETSQAGPGRVMELPSVAGADSGLVIDDYVSSALDVDTMERIDKISKALGVRTRFVNSVREGTANAAISGSEILVEKGNPNPVMAVLGHEWIHRMQELAPAEYQAFRRAIADDIQDTALGVQAIYEKSDISLTEDETLDEAAANYAGELLQDGRLLDRFIERHREDRTLLEKLRDALRSFIAKLTGAERRQAQTAEGKLTAALEAASERASALTEQQSSTAQESGKVRFSLKSFSDGQRFVDVQTDQSQFDNLTDKEKTRLAISIIKKNFAGRVIGLDNPVFVNGRSAAEYGHPVKNISSDIRDAKMRTATELDNLIDAGSNFRTAPDGADGHVHPQATGDFEYFDAVFKVGNAYYRGVINIENTAKGRLLKDITKIENITQDISSSYGTNPKSTFLRDVSMNSISENNEKSNTEFSLKGSENAEDVGKLIRENQNLRERVARSTGITAAVGYNDRTLPKAEALPSAISALESGLSTDTSTQDSGFLPGSGLESSGAGSGYNRILLPNVKSLPLRNVDQSPAALPLSPQSQSRGMDQPGTEYRRNTDRLGQSGIDEIFRTAGEYIKADGTFDLETAKADYNETLQNAPEKNKMYLQQSAEAVTYEQRGLKRSPFGYDANKDTMVYDPKHPAFKSLSLQVVLTHELAHRIDTMFVQSWGDSQFSEAIAAARSTLDKNWREMTNFCETRDEDGFLSDIMSAICEADYDFPYSHTKSYWKMNRGTNKTREIFANLFSLEAYQDQEKLDFLWRNFPELMSAYQKLEFEIR